MNGNPVHGTSGGRPSDISRTPRAVSAQIERETETSTTPSSRTDALGGGQHTTAALRDIHPLDAFAVTLAWIRGDWNLGAVRGVLARCHGSHHELAERALRVALATDAQGRFLAATPAAIENAGAIRREPAPQTYPTVAEALEPELCEAHEFRVGACPECRRSA